MKEYYFYLDSTYPYADLQQEVRGGCMPLKIVAARVARRRRLKPALGLACALLLTSCASANVIAGS